MPGAKRRLAAPLWSAALLLAACGPRSGDTGAPAKAPKPSYRFDRTAVDAALAADPGVVIGTYRLAPKGIVDGDTIKVEGLDASLRLLAIDTEETFKSKSDRVLYDQGWEVYLAKKAAQSNRPVKIATPLGEEAKHFAEAFFAGIDTVELERDHPEELRGRYGRILSYVFVVKDGKRLHYNVEAVRAGMAPYFPKYGHSRRFRGEFEAAMAEARAAGRGIWDPSKQHYPDYDARLAWWYARGDFVDAFESKAETRDDHIVLGRHRALERLSAFEGKDVSVLGTVAKIVETKGDLVLVFLAHRRGEDLPVVFVDPLAFEDSGIADYVGEYVVVRGPVQHYHDQRRKKDVFEVVVRAARQVTLPPYTPPGPTPVPQPHEAAASTRPRAAARSGPPSTEPPSPAPAP
ncbi:MAG: hypothetical protein D6705_06690 [Deltaproteobacteria bacterium]|nr:MAG: hypothetical protein D6705_06690 [Deltaproteobacteria bacterium]